MTRVSKKKKAGAMDWNNFVRQPDPEVKVKYKPPTEQKMHNMKQNFIQFTSNLQPPDYEYWLENVTLRLIDGYLRWYLENHDVELRSGFLVFARYWRMFWCRERNSLFPYTLMRPMTYLVSITLTEEYELGLEGVPRDPVKIDDLLYLTYHLMAFSAVKAPTVRCRHQHSTLRKMMTSTSARPGTITESSGYMRTNDALKWKDIELFMVKEPKNPKNPDGPTCQVLLMKVTHRLNKGKRNEGVPPKFIYTERNDNLGLCVIQDILEYAFLDNAFASQRLKEPRDIWRYTHVPDHRLSTPIHFKDSMGDIPVLRRAVKDAEGKSITDPILAYQYDRAREYEAAISKEAGFEDDSSLYKYRKGAAAEMSKGCLLQRSILAKISAGHLDEHSRNVIMGHSRSSTFSYYVQVQDDTQSAYMGTPARDALIKLATTAGLTRDPSAPQGLSDWRKNELEKVPDLSNLKSKRDRLRADVIARFHQLHKGRGSEVYREFQAAKRKVISERKKLHKATQKKESREFFKNVGNHIIEQNYQGKPVSFEPDLSHVVPERKVLADLEFQNRDVDKVSDAELVEDRIRSLELRLALHRLEVPMTLQKRIRFKELPAEIVTENTFTVPLESKSGLECPVCLGIQSHPEARKYAYARKDALQRHFRTHKLPDDFPEGRVCDYPECDVVLHSLTKYIGHQNEVHKIFL